MAELAQENIALYAKEHVEFYRDFKIDFKGTVYSRPYWLNVTNPTYAPQIFYQDINNDRKKELIITLTKGYGTGILEEEVYVFRYTNGLIDVLVDNPMVIIYKNVKTELTDEKVEIRVNKKQYTIDLRPLQFQPEHLFDDVGFGGIIDWDVKDKQLMVTVPAQVSPGAFIGEIVIIYEYKDKMYQTKTIDFYPYKK